MQACAFTTAHNASLFLDFGIRKNDTKFQIPSDWPGADPIKNLTGYQPIYLYRIYVNFQVLNTRYFLFKDFSYFQY